MFAASRGISGIAGVTKKTGHRPKESLPLRERLYIPCMWSTCGGCFVGLVIFCGGTALVVVAYFADHFSSSVIIEHHHNTTVIVTNSNSTLKFFLHALSYIGPIIMGIGAFLVIMIVVVVCETRDKVLDLMQKQRKGKDVKKNPDLYKLIMEEEGKVMS